jgi:hypothetical protein
MFDYRRIATIFLGNRWVNRLESCVCWLCEQFGEFQLVEQLAMKKYGKRETGNIHEKKCLICYFWRILVLVWLCSLYELKNPQKPMVNDHNHH